MFYCIPQQAYLSVTTCKNLRERPVGKARQARHRS